MGGENMSTVLDRNVIDNIVVEENSIILTINDHLQWNCVVREQHTVLLKCKIEDYINFIQSGQLNEYCKKQENCDVKEFGKIVIKVFAKYSYSKYCLDFFERVKKVTDDLGYEFEWGHLDDDKVQYNDGFSDDYVFDKEKVYPRIKVNYAKKPDKVILLMANMGANKTSDDIPMRRALEKYVYMVIQDVGDVYKIVEYSDLPEGYSNEQLFEQAFKNMCRDVKYRIEETIEKGIYGLLAGGNFEAESLLLDVWGDVSSKFNDDLIISVPAKDLVFFVPYSNKKMVKKLISFSRNVFENVRKSTNNNTLFTRDVFIYEKNSKTIRIYKKDLL